MVDRKPSLIAIELFYKLAQEVNAAIAAQGPTKFTVKKSFFLLITNL